MDTIYRPSVCYQTNNNHVHYNIVLMKPPSKDSSNEDMFRRLANKVGGQTVGQVVTILLEKRSLGIDLNQYGIDYIKTEILPGHQKCHKGEVESPALDWDAWLFVPYQEPPQRPLANPKVARIRHTKQASA